MDKICSFGTVWSRLTIIYHSQLILNSQCQLNHLIFEKLWSKLILDRNSIANPLVNRVEIVNFEKHWQFCTKKSNCIQFSQLFVNMTIQSILIWLFQTFYKRFTVGENYEEKSHFQALWLYTCLKGIFMVIYINDCYSLPKVELEQIARDYSIQ